MSDAAKVSKKSVNYRPATTDHRCGNCSMYDNHVCTLVRGDIDPDHVCDRWDARNHSHHRINSVSVKETGLEKKSVAALSMQAMSLNIPTDPHPNKMPFSGILTRIGVPSDAAPDGSGGRRVMITAEAAKKALDSLLGMAVDYQPNFDGHDPKVKIGVLTAADIVTDDDGQAIAVKGFIYAADFPDVAAQIKEHKQLLGMSFEARDLWTNDADAEVMPIVDCVFTGAAILFKDLAAYKTTSIAAKAAAQSISEEDIEMSEEIKKQLADLAAAMTKVSEAVAAQGEKLNKIENDKVEAANQLAKVEKHAAEMEKAADHMDAAGIGGHPTRGHAAILRNMAGDLRAQAAVGKMPHTFDYFMAAAEKVEDKKAVEAKIDVEGIVKAEADKIAAEMTKKLDEVKAAAEAEKKELTDKLGVAETQLSDMKAAAEKAKAEATPGPGADKAAGTPERKTLSPMATQLLAKGSVELPKEADGKLTVDAIDDLAGKLNLSIDQRFQFKTELKRANLI